MTEQRNKSSTSFTGYRDGRAPAAKKAVPIPAPKPAFSIPAPKAAFSIPTSRRAYFGEEGQRDKVLRITGNSPEGSVGEAIHVLLNIVVHSTVWMSIPVVRNSLAGNSGNFFEDHKALLDKPATDENIREWSRIETKFWESQPLAVRNAGRLFTEEMRVWFISFAARTIEELRELKKSLGEIVGELSRRLEAEMTRLLKEAATAVGGNFRPGSFLQDRPSLYPGAYDRDRDLRPGSVTATQFPSGSGDADDFIQRSAK